MSMIDVQGTRSKEKESSPQGRDKYEDKSDARGLSHMPFYAGAAISALVLYLKESLTKPAPLHGLAAEEAKPHPHGGSAQASAGDDQVAPDDVAAAQSSSPWDYRGEGSDNQLSGGGGSAPPDRLPALIATPSGWSMGDRYHRDSLDTQFRPMPENGSGTADAPMNFPAYAGNDNSLGRGPSRRASEAAEGAAEGTAGNAGGRSARNSNTQAGTPRTNHAPKVSGRVKLADEFTSANFAILVSQLLGKTTDEDGDQLGVRDVRVNGVLLTPSNGHYSYQGETVGPVVITYQVTDGLSAVLASAEVMLKQKPAAAGTDGDDLLQGTAGNDQINGGAGKDQIDGLAGHDVITGGDGDDAIMGGDGRDYIYDGAGKDIIHGGAGNDTIFASADHANDIFDGDAGTNKLSYVSAAQGIVFDLGRGTATGADIGHDRIKNFQILEGGSAGDTFLTTLSSGAGTNLRPLPPAVSLPVNQDPGTQGSGTQGSGTQASVQATPHTTSVYLPSTAPDAAGQAATPPSPVSHADQHNTYLGGGGSDVIDYSGAQQTITVDLRHGTVQGVELGTDFVSSIETFITGSGDDRFIASGAFEQHHMKVTDAPAGAGNSAGPVDTTTNAIDLSDKSHDGVSGAAANQQFCGGQGADTLDYSNATHAVTINTTTGTATGQDIGIDLFDGIEHLIGGSGDDAFIMGSGAIVVDGQGGADVFQFVGATDASGPSLTIAHIEGFEVGDRVRMSMYDLFDVPGSDPFADIYSAQQNGSVAAPDLLVPIRLRIEGANDHQSTYIDADLDSNGSYEITVQLDGNHHLTIVNNHIA